MTTSSRGAAAAAVTIPACYWILSNAPEPAHGHDDHGDSHGKEHEEEHEEDEEKDESKDEPEEESKEESKDEGEDKAASSDAEDKDSEKSEDSDSDDAEKKGEDTPDTSDDEGGDDESKDDGKNTVKSIPDAKGGSKKRLESNAAIKAGEKDSSDDSVCLQKISASSLMLISLARHIQACRRKEFTIRKARRSHKHGYQTLHRYHQRPLQE